MHGRALGALLSALLFGCGGGSTGSGDADAGPSSADAGPTGINADYLFDESEVRTYEFTLDAGDWAWLQDNARAEIYVPATLTFEGTEIANVGLRFKGAIGSLHFQGPIEALRQCFPMDQRSYGNCPKLGMKASFNEYDPDGKWAGLKKLQFHSMGNDASKMVERIGYKLFRDMNVFAPRAVHARLVINGELQGLFMLIEQIDGRFTRERFPDGGEGNLYKEVWPTSSSEQYYLGGLKTNRDENPSADKMVRFAAALQSATDANFEQMLDTWTDSDMLMRKMAVDRAIEHWDGIVAFYCGAGASCDNHNYYWYESTTEDKIWLIPWDLDRAMVWPPPIRTIYGMPDWDDTSSCTPVSIFFNITGMPPGCDKLIGSMSRVMWSRYVAATQQLLAGPFTKAAMSARIDEIAAQIAPHVEADPWLSASEWQAAVSQFRVDIEAMHDSIAAKIAN